MEKRDRPLHQEVTKDWRDEIFFRVKTPVTWVYGKLRGHIKT